MSKQIAKRFLTGAMYAPFCRTLHAPMEEWDNDMKTMAELGYTCLHGFAEWHDIEYEKGDFDFSKIDHFVSCAFKNGLVPIVNVATQNGVGFYPPRWFMEEYRGNGVGVIDALGNRALQSEYVIPCIDDPFYQQYAERYLIEVAKHFAGDDRVGGYVLWGEPTFRGPSQTSEMICYCPHTRAKFIEYLKEKYKNIAKLNEVWGYEGPSCYDDFDMVYPPTGYTRQRGGFSSWNDWCDFMESNLTNHIKRADKIFKENGALQPTINEMLPGINNGLDPWKLAEATDIVGISLFGKPTKNTMLCMTISDSISKANDKTTFVIEAGGGSIKFDDPNPFAASGFTPSADELKTAIMMRAGFGTKGLMYWCWRPRLSDLEGNDFGMCKPNGKPLARTYEIGQFAKRMLELSQVYNSSARRSDVAIYTSYQINRIMKGDRMSDNYLGSVIGANYMLTDLHINSDFINDKQILKGRLSQYKVLILPCTYIIDEDCAEKIAEFVENGGVVIADYILAEKCAGGLCYMELPGAGLDKVFGIEREDVLYIAHPTMERENTFGVKTGTIIEQVNLRGAQSISEEYLPGFYMMTQNEYGKGNANYIATQFFSKYEKEPTKELREHVLKLLRKAGVTQSLELLEEDRKDSSAVVTSIMSDQDNNLKIITLSNTDYEEITDTLLLPLGEYEFVENNGSFTISNEGGVTMVKFTLKALESMALFKR